MGLLQEKVMMGVEKDLEERSVRIFILITPVSFERILTTVGSRAKKVLG
jgi:hypothetical protein